MTPEDKAQLESDLSAIANDAAQIMVRAWLGNDDIKEVHYFKDDKAELILRYKNWNYAIRLRVTADLVPSDYKPQTTDTK